MTEKKNYGEHSKWSGEDYRHEGHREHGQHGDNGDRRGHGEHGGGRNRGDYGHNGENEGHGKHEDHRNHGEHRDGGEHRNHGGGRNHGERGQHGGHGNLMMSARYTELGNDGKLFAILQELGHFCRFSFEGKGGQGRILNILAKDGEMSQKELTERIGIQPGSASEVLGKLERGGYIVREPEETDKRTFIVRLTEEGSARAAELEREREARLGGAFSALSDEEKEQMLLLAEKLYAAWIQPRQEEKTE